MSHYKTKIHTLEWVDMATPIAIVVAEFNRHFTVSLEDETAHFLQEQGFWNIDRFLVPGAFELPGMVGRLLEKEKYGLIIALGVVVRGDTPHFDYVCGESARGLMDLTLAYDTPIINGILTCNTDEQVTERIGPNYAIAGLNLLREVTRISHE